MPEKLLDDLDEQQTRDLFAYLQSAGPLSAGGGQQAQPVPRARRIRRILEGLSGFGFFGVQVG